MRTFLFAALAFSMLSAPAFADPVSAVSLSPGAQKAFTKTYGEREVPALSGALHKAITRALERRGVSEKGNLRVEITIVEATPSRPTFHEMTERPSLSMGSVSLGGAALQARLVDASGRTVDEVMYRWYSNDLRNSFTAATWTDAHFAIDRFALKVAAAYAAANA